MNSAYKIFATTVLSVAAAGAQAQTQPQAPSKLYAEIGLTAVNLEITSNGAKLKSNPTGLSAVLGYQLHPNVAVEGFLGLASTREPLEFNGTPVGLNAKIDSAAGFFIKPSVMVSNNVELFARLGYLRTKITVSSAAGSTSDSDTGTAYGLGANLYLTKTSYVQANWTSYYKESGVKSQGATLAYGMRF